MYAGHLVCGFVRIPSRDKARVLLLPAAPVAKLDLVYVHGDNSPTGHFLRPADLIGPPAALGARGWCGKGVPSTHLSALAPKSSITSIKPAKLFWWSQRPRFFSRIIILRKLRVTTDLHIASDMVKFRCSGGVSGH